MAVLRFSPILLGLENRDAVWRGRATLLVLLAVCGLPCLYAAAENVVRDQQMVDRGNLPIIPTATTYFGWSVSYVDVNQDGRPEAVSGTPYTSCDGQSYGTCGSLYVIFLNADGTPNATNVITNSSGYPGYVFEMDTEYGWGESVANLGDIGTSLSSCPLVVSSPSLAYLPNNQTRTGVTKSSLALPGTELTHGASTVPSTFSRSTTTARLPRPGGSATARAISPMPTRETTDSLDGRLPT
jgi:hypothetical protein